MQHFYCSYNHPALNHRYHQFLDSCDHPRNPRSNLVIIGIIAVIPIIDIKPTTQPQRLIQTLAIYTEVESTQTHEPQRSQNESLISHCI